MENPNYPCAQKDLYPSCRLGWQSCTENLAVFTAYKNKYTAPFIAARLTEVTNAELIKGLQARTLAAEGYHADLVAMANTDRENFQTLKRYIADAFPPDRHKMQYEAAGQEYYLKATQNNWGAVEALNTMAYLYITEFEAILTTDGYMPASFVTKYNDDRDAFAAMHLLFMNQEETDEESTQGKIIANNNIYAELLKMCLDGQEIFKNDEVMRKQFTFTEILKKASSTGTAGVRGVVRDADTNQPIENVDVHPLDSNKNALTDAAGRYEIKPMAQGFYDIRFVAPGYNDIVINQHEVLSGTISTLDVLLTPLP